MNLRHFLATLLCLGFVMLVPTAGSGVLNDITPFPKITTSDLAVYGKVQFKNSSNILISNNNGVFFSSDSGKNWNNLGFENVIDIAGFDYFPKIAMVFTNSNRHFYTFDQGDTWKHFDLSLDVPIKRVLVQINYANKDHMLFTFYYTNYGLELQFTYYSDDGLNSSLKPINTNFKDCKFTKINPEFIDGGDTTIVCIRTKRKSFDIFTSEKIISTTDFFKTIVESNNIGVRDLPNWGLSISGSFILLRPNIPLHSNSLYISKDGINFFVTNLDNQNDQKNKQSIVRKHFFTSTTKDAVYITLQKFFIPHMTQLRDVYKSDADGKNVRKIFGDVSSTLFQNVKDSGKVWIASHIDESLSLVPKPTVEEVRIMKQAPNSITMITFDDGENWNYLNVIDPDDCNNDGECSLHLIDRIIRHDNLKDGDPDLLVGIGNLGKYFDNSYENLKTFISKDGGLSWEKLYDKPCIFTSGDSGNIFIAVPFLDIFSTNPSSELIDYFSYSLDQGKTWVNVEFGIGIDPLTFFKQNGNDSKVFNLSAYDSDASTDLVFHIDFSRSVDMLEIKSDESERNDFDQMHNQSPLKNN